MKYSLQEAANVAWHVRVNGLDHNLKPEQIIAAFAVLEQLCEQMKRVEALPAKWRGQARGYAVMRSVSMRARGEECRAHAGELERELRGDR